MHLTFAAAGRRQFSAAGRSGRFAIAAALAWLISGIAWGRVQTAEPWPTVPAVLGEHMAEIVALQPSDRKLKIEICNAVQPAMEAVRQIASGQGSTASGGGNFWMASSAGENAAMLAGKGDPYRSNETLPLRVQYTELKSAGWRLDLKATEEGGFSLLAFARHSPHLLYFEQAEAGPVRAVCFGPDGLTFARAEFFGELVEHHPTLTSDLLLPQLRNWGICRLSGKKSRAIRDLILHLFKPFSADAEWNAVIEKLDSSKFLEREEATEWLMENAPRRLSEIFTTIQHSDTSSEVLSRLRKVLKVTLPEHEYDSFEFMESQQLTQDPEYLVWLAEQLQTNQELPDWLNDEMVRRDTVANIFKRLREVTKQMHGDDVAAWRQWLTTSGAGPVVDTGQATVAREPLELGAPPAELTRWTAEFRNLLPLAVQDERLVIDRDHWQRLFQGKSVKELVAEARAFLQERNLPRNWLAIDDRQEAILDYPQILFSRLEAALAQEPADDQARSRRQQIQMMSANSPMRNLRVATNQWTGTLEVDEGHFLDTYHRSLQRSKRDGGDAPDVYILDFQANSGVPWRFFCGAWPDGQVRLVLLTETDLVQIFQDASGASWLDVASQSGQYHQRYSAVGQLLADPEFQRAVRPRFAEFGVELPSQ